MFAAGTGGRCFRVRGGTRVADPAHWQTQLIFYNSYGIFFLGVWGSCDFFRGDGGAFGVACRGNGFLCDVEDWEVHRCVWGYI